MPHLCVFLPGFPGAEPAYRNWPVPARGCLRTFLSPPAHAEEPDFAVRNTLIKELQTATKQLQ